MNQLAKPKLNRLIAWVGLILFTLLASGLSTRAQDAEGILKAMANYVAGQKKIFLTYDSDVEVITPSLQKLQFTASGQLMISRPDNIRATRTGGYADVELVFDGKTVSIYGKNIDAFAQKDIPGTIDQLVDRLRADDGLDMPGADILLARSYDELMEDVIEAKHIGRGVVNGVECEHLAFRNPDVDWQLWVEVGANPIPRKYVITSKAVNGAPQYTLRIKEWRTDVQFAADAFAFKPPANISKVDAAKLVDIDEIPQGVSVGGKK